MNHKKIFRTALLLTAVFIVLSACSLSTVVERVFENLENRVAEEVTETAQPQATESLTIPTELPAAESGTVLVPEYTALEGSLEALYEKISPGVVSIKVSTVSGDGQGTGFVIDKQGHIVTNYHVIADAQQIEVDFVSGEKVYGTLVGSDIDSDLAVVKVDVDENVLVPLIFGDSDLVKVGQTVVAIGNPYGLGGTMTLGIVSARGRILDSMRQTQTGTYYSSGDSIQTDALINPGNSGGPLLNMNAEVIGVNRAIQTSGLSITGDAINTGIGFAISANIARKVVPSLIENGSYAYPYLGLSSYQDLSLEMIELFGLNRTTGAYISEVVKGGPADLAGLRGATKPTAYQGVYTGGDLIIAVDGIEIKNFSELMSYMVVNKNPGEVLVFTILRDGEQLDIPVTLGKRE